MLGLSIALSLGNPLFRGGISEADVFAGAGVTAGVTPGVLDRATGTTAGVYNTDFGVLNGTHADTAKGVFNITQASDFTGHAAYISNGSSAVGSDGRTTYTISGYLFYTPSTADSWVTWNDTDADYHIRFYNCAFLTPAANKNMLDIVDSGGRTFTLDTCNVGGLGNATANYSLCKVTLGNVVATRCFITRATGYAFWKAGASATITLSDSEFNTTAPGGSYGESWPSVFGAQQLIYNSVAGGSISVSRTTVDHKQIGDILRAERDVEVTLDRILWNSSDSANPQSFIRTNAAAVLEAWTSGLTITDSKLYSGNGAQAMIGWQAGSEHQTIANFTITNCDFEATGTKLTGASMIRLGKTDAVATGTCDNVLISWCRFTRDEGTDVAAGNEIIYIAKCSNTIIEYCWTDACGEDAFEFQQPYDGCGVRYCGGGVPSTSTVGGNIVDVYGALGNWTESTNCFAHHIWGTCGGDAVIVDSCTNVTVNDIDVDNVAGDFTDNVPRANVRLHCRTANGLNGVTVTEPLSDPSISWDGIPCYLTREPTAETTVTGTAPSGVSPQTITVATSAGMSAGMMIGIELATGGMHQTTVVNAPTGTMVTIVDGLPSDSKLNAEVYAVSAFDAGTVSWPEWNGSSFDARDGTAGGVAEMSSL